VGPKGPVRKPGYRGDWPGHYGLQAARQSPHLDYLAPQLAQAGQPAGPQHVAALADPLVPKGLLMTGDGKLLSLAIPGGTYLPSSETRQRFDHILMPLSARHGNDWVVLATLIECVHSRGAGNWCQLLAGSGGSQGLPAMALAMASSAVTPWAAAESR
jgi:hypothetical protein